MIKMHERQRTAYQLAESNIGLKEIRGTRHNPEIVDFFAAVGHEWVKDDETAWCAAFVGAMLEEAGLKSTRKLNARSYLKWGEPVDIKDVRVGDILVFWRGKRDSWQGHVGFYVGHDGKRLNVLGGNQSNEVTIAPYPFGRLLGVRRMPAPPEPVKVEVVNERPSWFMLLLRFVLGLLGGGNKPFK